MEIVDELRKKNPGMSITNIIDESIKIINESEVKYIIKTLNSEEITNTHDLMIRVYSLVESFDPCNYDETIRYIIDNLDEDRKKLLNIGKIFNEYFLRLKRQNQKSQKKRLLHRWFQCLSE